MRQASRERGGGELAERLRERRSEIEQGTLTRVYAVSEPPRSGPEYIEGLRVAVSAGVDYGLEGIERGEQSALPIPEVLLAQARLAARSGVSLDTVLRRYFAGHTLLEDFMVEEAERDDPFDPTELKRLLRSQAAIVDRLLAAVSGAYTEEAKRRPESSKRRHAVRIERLLAGEMLDTTGIAYDFDGWQLGMVAMGPEVEKAIASLAERLGLPPLIVRHEEGAIWAWLACRDKPDPEELRRLAIEQLPEGISLAIGEPGRGISGWRLSHRQARVALPIVLRRQERVVRYSEVALIASVLHDDLLKTSLHELFLTPLEREHGNGEVLRQTLRAYLDTGCSVSSAAAIMGVKRHTVTNRIRIIEEKIGCSIDSRIGEIDTALQLGELTDSLWHPPACSPAVMADQPTTLAQPS